MWYALVIADFIQSGLFFFKFSTLPPQLPLFYSKSPGEPQIADTWLIGVLPLLMNLLVIVNWYAARRWFPENIFVKHTVVYLNMFLIVSLTLIFVKILFLVS